MRIAYAGIEGAFAHQACLAFAQGYEPVPFPDFEAVVSAVQSGDVDLGMVPIHNSRAGEVHQVTKLLVQSSVGIVEELALAVRMHLLGLPGTQLADLEVVTSHPIALLQCARSIERLGLRTQEALNTALAAQALQDPKVGVLASEAAAAAYGLQILESDVQDDPNNATTFAIIGLR